MPLSAVRTARSLVTCLVFSDDRRGNAAALTYLVPAAPGPGPDFRAPLPAGTSPRPAAPPAARAYLARAVGVLAELVMQFFRMRGAHVDLVRGSVKGERDRLPAFDLVIVGKVADDRHHRLLSHECQPFR